MLSSAVKPLGLAELVVAAMLTGLIWTIQVVHYPLFAQVGREHFAAYEAAHTQTITLLVGPLMLAEVALGLAALFLAPSWLRAFAFGLVVVIWLSTAFLQVPLHTRLSSGFDADAQRALVATNWLRTASWSLRTGMLAWLAFTASSVVAPR
jgi:hypothetical protein